MARDTDLGLRRQVIYSIFVRNYSEEGTFAAVRRDLDRIQALGPDILWLMPIHPVGEKNRKGTLGSPYAIRDYRAVNPEFGTLEDFKALVEDIHARGMKCIIDVVYNHTSPDSVLSKEHPDWFYHRPDGSFGNRIGEWWDVIDLDYGTEETPKRELWDYQIETLKMWAGIVDGFRCDVAPMVPVAFWREARQEVAKVRPGCIWLAESVEPAMVVENRRFGIPCASDSEIFTAFDISYEYDIHWEMNRCLTGEGSLSDYAEAINRQEGIYPANYVKLRYLENHDRLRAHFLIPDEKRLRSWTAFLCFQKGTTLLYAGQEKGAVHTPGLFDKDPVDWEGQGPDLTPLLQKLIRFRHEEMLTDASYEVHALPGDILLAIHTKNRKNPGEGEQEKLVGVFPVGGRAGALTAKTFGIPDGMYRDVLTGETAEVNMGQMYTAGEPVIFMVPAV